MILSVAVDLQSELAKLLAEVECPIAGAIGSEKKNYTEKISRHFAPLIAAQIQELGLLQAQAPFGRDRQFMGGYGPKGVDVFLADEKHGLMLSSGNKGILYDVRKNLKNRYRDIVMEALELHKRFPYAVCGHLVFLGRSEVGRASRAFGTVLREAVVLLEAISGRRRPEEPAELYEAIGLVLFEPGDCASIDLAPQGVPPGLHAATYAHRLVEAFKARNPFYFG